MEEKLKETALYIAQNANETLALAHLAALANLSPYHFQRSFKAYFGLSPKDFQTMIRKKILKNELRNNDNIIDAIFGAGFGSTSRVYGNANNIGMDLSKYRNKGLGEIIHYKIAKSTNFQILMAASQKGVCAIEIGDNDNELLGRLNNEFPNAKFEIAPESIELNQWIHLLCDYLDNLKPLPNIPLDLRGTLFQEKIWRFLTTIKNGETLTYGQIAQKLNMPKSARAIANAIAHNKIAILIPCHRVLRGDNGIGGYKWGVENKRKLLAENL